MTEPMTAPDAERLQANHGVVERFVQTVNAKTYDKLDEFVHPDYVDHDPIPGQGPGIDGLKASYQIFDSTFPDIQFALEDVVAEDDLVVARGVLSGTNSGPFMGIPPTGRPMRWTATRMFRIRDGKISEGWLNIDMVGMLVQMGVIPPPPG
jgi:predicted ester cyclase